MRDEDFSGVRVGDRVVVNSRYGLHYEIAHVTAVTPTQIIVGAMRFHKDSGNRRGDSGYYRASISIAPSAFARAHYQMAIERFDQRVSPSHENIAFKRKACDAMEAALLECEKLGIKP